MCLCMSMYQGKIHKSKSVAVFMVFVAFIFLRGWHGASAFHVGRSPVLIGLRNILPCPVNHSSTNLLTLRTYSNNQRELPWSASKRVKLRFTSSDRWSLVSLIYQSRPTSIRLFGASANDDDDESWDVPSTIYIPEDSLDISFVRSSGAGGQNVNKVNTNVQIRVMIDAMGWLPYEVRERLRQQQANRINKDGFLVFQVQEFRTQFQNRKAALQKLREMILQAWPRPKKRNMRTGISEKTKRQRRDDKQKRKIVKEGRRRVDF